jgi:hypothetical protein
LTGQILTEENDMTRQEFYDKYGSVKVKFSYYYKYTFTYEATLPGGIRLTCGYGGNSDDIYRREVIANREEDVNSLQPHEGVVYQNG